ncbi:MAG: DNA polymerase IV [Candidatus Caldatribacteriota bacterium]
MISDNHRLPIIHLDLDAFFASVEQRDNPIHQGKPLIVGGISDGGRGNLQRGVVCAASYEARKYGIYAGMPIWEAHQKCPKGVFLPARLNKYIKESRKFFQICSNYTPLSEPLGLDELFLDVSGCEALFGSSKIIAKKIKERVYQELGLKVSVGIAQNKFLAKIATNLGKPDGFFVLYPEDVPKILYPLPLSFLWGIGKKTEEQLKKSGIYLIGQLAQIPDSVLENLLGKNGKRLKLLAQGLDNSPVTIPTSKKSISKETTFSANITEKNILIKELLKLSQEVGYYARKEGYRGRTVTLKLRFHNFTTLNKSITLKNPTHIDECIFKIAIKLLDKIKIKKRGVRLLGIKLSNLISSNQLIQLNLLNNKENKWAQLTYTLDQLREKYGSTAITRATLLE